jgi:hypothetical protein
MGGVLYIAAGHNYNPVNKRYLKDDNDRYGMRDRWDREMSVKAWKEYLENELMPRIERLPTHYEYLKKHIHNKEL